jgi:hypothetical protein
MAATGVKRRVRDLTSMINPASHALTASSTPILPGKVSERRIGKVDEP